MCYDGHSLIYIQLYAIVNGTCAITSKIKNLEFMQNRNGNKLAYIHSKVGLQVRMVILARPVGTRSDPTLMGRVLPGPIKNRVEYGFFF